MIISETEDLAERVAEITGQKGVYAALDAVGGDMMEQVTWRWGPDAAYRDVRHFHTRDAGAVLRSGDGCTAIAGHMGRVTSLLHMP